MEGREFSMFASRHVPMTTLPLPVSLSNETDSYRYPTCVDGEVKSTDTYIGRAVGGRLGTTIVPAPVCGRTWRADGDPGTDTEQVV